MLPCMAPWISGSFLEIWKFSYRSLTDQEAGVVVIKVESLMKCSALFHTNELALIAMESSGVFGLQSLAFFWLQKEVEIPDWRREYILYPSPSHMAVQWCNAISILEGLGSQHCT